MKDTLVLTVITLIAGLLLGTVYEITKEPIAKQQAMTKENAYQEVFMDAQGFQTYTVSEEDLAQHLAEAGFHVQRVNEVLTAIGENQESLGYALQVTTSEGYGGDITFSMGVRMDGTLNGISILSINETAGLGMKANTEAFKNQFRNKNEDEFTYTKSKITSENEIDAISGATITTNAVTNGVNAGLCAFWYIKGGK